MTISITQKHIDAGVPGSCDNHPVALAVRESTGMLCIANTNAIEWGQRDALRCGYPHEHYMCTPSAVREFMDRYDEGLPVEPISFELEAA